MKQINSTVSAQFKAVCRKTLLASALLCGFSMMQGGRIKMRSPPKVLTGNFRPSQLSFFLS